MSKSQNDQHLQELFEFDRLLIKGYPELRWRGKRPFESINYYPAQRKEAHGSDTEGWFNKIFWGDNLQVMAHLLRQFRGKVKLIYIDPPFDSKADYKKKIQLRGKSISNDSTTFEEKQYTDIWSNDEYLQFMYERLILMKELLHTEGSIFVHCDWHKSHYLRSILDEIFGNDRLINEIVWQRTSAGKSSSNNLPKNTDTIFWFSKSETFCYKQLTTPLNQKDIESFNKDDNDSRGPYNTQPIISPNRRENLIYFYTNNSGVVYTPPPNGWRFNQDRMKELEANNRLVFSEKGIREKNYLRDRELVGKQISNLWTDISGNTTGYSSESVDYPTQKPEKLLERIIQASSNEGDLIFDCFMGSGTTQAVAMKTGRKFIGADINLGAIQTTTKRLLAIKADIESKLQTETRYTGFEVWNVNNYDIFRNPVQAKDLLINALDITPLPNSTIYDGQKDGRDVKIMPVNRIATRQDLNELITNFNYKEAEEKHKSAPTKPVAHLLLVCMGHEPDLKATLELALKPFKIDVQVVDILKDRQDLEFKRDAEADIKIEADKLVIHQFYPMNLLQKLSMQTENIEDWRELVESVMVDWYYDGSVFSPAVVDVPDKQSLVRGTYTIPKDAGRIRVKITDLLSESLEKTIE